MNAMKYGYKDTQKTQNPECAIHMKSFLAIAKLKQYIVVFSLIISVILLLQTIVHTIITAKYNYKCKIDNR